MTIRLAKRGHGMSFLYRLGVYMLNLTQSMKNAKLLNELLNRHLSLKKVLIKELRFNIILARLKELNRKKQM
jgi:hypothetical protein